jgi:hypothetical protein
MEICTYTRSRKLLVLAKESENIQRGNAEQERKVVKRANVKTYCVTTKANISRDIAHSSSTRTFAECSFKCLVQNFNYKESN